MIIVGLIASLALAAVLGVWIGAAQDRRAQKNLAALADAVAKAASR